MQKVWHIIYIGKIFYSHDYEIKYILIHFKTKSMYLYTIINNNGIMYIVTVWDNNYIY